ncbi:MAG: Methylthioribose-1-phosphate isomerase [Deltaproteobacteria bacterium ADurb.Bin151]|jgi:methylthioribose-1-phosphate isomerase|nr:S-methyl-5-thioribose-1-phosphate isomerase [Smithella sp.]OQB55809.1 MAG: Methylthioribose-1-phosphate isomerase [Deltaproteobacteria bacterium ADurb.Bin151]HNZ11549.1 S-methyl-5-thioribose-1-phosphate isomerase [Smithellaceae bacterium]HOG82477.1 S-methyl-5-thioribose-1-phosphate isomerase [Smithellaceae bacterium]HQP26051.1 S-methyl-5-thioribose-1-phosphate isomerase [Smithellaceae bacterium]
MMIQTVFWKNNKVVMIDQKALPLNRRQLVCSDYRQVITAIKDLTVRGAPAIGVAAAMGAALGALSIPSEPVAQFRKKFHAVCNEIEKSRPTARNLFWAIERMKEHLENTILSGKKNLAGELIREAKRICAEDIEINRRIGQHGSALISDGDQILTHCNAGALATAGYGTALGVIRAAREQGKKIHVYVDETRPVLQGARLTAWEMKEEKIPATLICDNMAGFLMQQNKISKIIVGADRIVANGDTANKIGTYSLAVLAKSHGIPFYIAAPISTFDFSLKTGATIPIEERNGAEVTHFKGVQSAPQGVKVYNPAFDITPGKLISAIITERGIITRPYSSAIARLRKGIT